MVEKEKNPVEGKREVALKNLKSEGGINLRNVAASYLVHKSKQFGDAGDNAMSEFKYLPAFTSGLKAYDNESGEEYDVIQQSIVNSREDDELYSGNVSEKKIMKDCTAIVNESLDALKIEDVMELVGANTALKEGFKGKYMRDLVPKYSKEEAAKLTPEQKKSFSDLKGIYQNLASSYQTYLATKGVSEALAESVKQIPKGLEKILVEPEKKESGN